MKILIFFSLFLIGCKQQSDIHNSSITKRTANYNKPPKPIQKDRSEQFCLPVINQSFLDLKYGVETNWEDIAMEGFYFDDVYLYLYFSADSTSKKTITKADDEYGIMNWEQTFENGIKYEYIQLPEVGAEGNLYTQCKDKARFLKVIEPVIRYVPCENCYDPNMVWKKDSSAYEPFGADPGCYYAIEQDDSGYYKMSWYCGC